METEPERTFALPRPRTRIAAPAGFACTTGLGSGRVLGWARVRWIAAGLYFLALAVVVAIDGVPTGRSWLAGIIILGLAITTLGRGWRRLWEVARDWLPFTAILMLYDRSRDIADAVGIRAHESDVLAAEKWLFGGTEPTVWLQQHFYTPLHVHWYDALATLVYITHFLATPVLAAILWLRNRAVWMRYVSRVVALSVAGLATYVLFPEAPPWLAANDGLTDPVARLSARGWIWLRANHLHALLDGAQKGGPNPVAAMPSLHLAFAVLVAIFMVARLRSRWRYLVTVYPIVMGVTLVYCGEHYVIDLIAGVAYAFGVHVLLSRWERGRALRRADRHEESVATPAAAPVRITRREPVRVA